MAVPPLAQNVLTLVGMFWMSYRLNPTLALLSLSVVPFLYYSVGYYITAHPAAAADRSRGWKASRCRSSTRRSRCCA